MKTKYLFLSFLFLSAAMIMIGSNLITHADDQLTKKIQPASKPRNIIFILSDDHRYDFMGFTGKIPGLVTPNMDRMAKEGVHFQNAFVTTSLCSPSRASILTGQYAHTHRVVNNYAQEPGNLIYFPEYLQKNGYQTAFIGKWHMGNAKDDPRPGFDYWVSPKGQGVYYNPRFNINGKQVQYKDSSYVSDVLTDLSLDWLKNRKKDKPFFLYLSHKAVHEGFQPARRDKGRYCNIGIQYPATMFITAGPNSKLYTKGKKVDGSDYVVNYKDIPQWVRDQRYSEHGVDYMAHNVFDFDQSYQDYLECLMGVDNSIGRILDYITKSGLDKETLIIYMGDNGFAFGEHGLVDKRTAYEESMRVPLLVWGPSLVKQGTKINKMVLNIDIAPSILELAGIEKPGQMQGRSFLPLLEDERNSWRNEIFYEYYWEYNYPQTPTQFAVRTDRYKFILTMGVWDINQLYDLKQDPYEANNLIRSPEHQEIAKKLDKMLWDWLEQTDAMSIPLYRINKVKRKSDHKYEGTW